HDLPAAERLVAAVLGIDGNAGEHVLLGVALLGRRGQRGLDRLENHRLRHALLGRDRVDYKQPFLAHLKPLFTVSSASRDAHRDPTCPVPAPAPVPPSRAPAAPCRCCPRPRTSPCRRRRKPPCRLPCAGSCPAGGAFRPSAASARPWPPARRSARTGPA